MSHCHAHSCKHEKVEFCKDCQKVYCKDCKTEWEPPCTQPHYPNWIYTYPTYPTTTPNVPFYGMSTTTAEVTAFCVGGHQQ